MPDKPVWYGRIDLIITELSSLPLPWIDRQTIETVLQVGRRRAQQILRPCVSHRIGSNVVAHRDTFIEQLKKVAAGDEVYYEQRRRQRLAKSLCKLNRDVIDQPPLLVEASRKVTESVLTDMPPGIFLAPGAIRVEFKDPTEALQKLLALAMAIGNDFDTFEQLTQTTQTHESA